MRYVDRDISPDAFKLDLGLVTQKRVVQFYYLVICIVREEVTLQEQNTEDGGRINSHFVVFQGKYVRIITSISAPLDLHRLSKRQVPIVVVFELPRDYISTRKCSQD